MVVLAKVGAWSLRPLRPDDCDRLREWRNSPRIRAASHNQDEINPDEHRAWFDRMMTRTDGLWTIFEIDGQPAGHINATAADGVWRWSFYIGTTDAPRGLGRGMTRLFLSVLHERGAKAVVAETLRHNVPSIRLHERLGFQEVEPDPTSPHQRWRLDL